MPPKPTSKQSSMPPTFVVVLFLYLITLAVYWPSMRGGFLWDDDVLLTGNPVVRQSDGLTRIWTGNGTTDYFPLTLTTFWMEWRLFGMNPFGYHFVNVLLHATGAVLLWRIFRQLKIPGAFVGAAIFAVHPVCVASVSWIAERKNTLSIVFFFLAVLLYLKADTTTGAVPATRHHRRWYCAAVFSFILALLSKTSVVVLPLVLLGCSWWTRGTVHRRDVIRSIPFFALSLVFGLVTVAFQSKHAFTDQPDPLVIRLLGGGMAVWFYLLKMVWPVQLSMVYPRWEIQASSILAWIPWVAIVGLLGLLWRFRKTPWAMAGLFCLGYFILTLLPVLGFFDMSFFAFSRVADHLAYLSLVAVAGLAGAIIATKMPRQFHIASAAVIGTLAFLAWTRAHVFASSEQLWTDTIKKNPKAWAAYNHLGEDRVWKGDIPGAMELFQSALRLNPDYPFAHYNLGNAYAHQGRHEEAIASFKNVLRVWPDYAQAENGLGLSFVARNELNQAVQHFENALRAAPDYVDAHFHLGVTLQRKGESSRALEHFQAALRTSPDHIPARLELAAVLSELGKFDESVAQYHEAIRQDPSMPEIHNGLGLTFMKHEKLPQAEQSFRDAVQLLPDNAVLWKNLGDVLFRQQKYNDAVAALEKASRFAPQDTTIRSLLTEVRAKASN